MDYVNQIKTKDGSLYDIQDKRVDSLTSGTKLYKHILDCKDRINQDFELIIKTTRADVFTSYEDIYKDKENTFQILHIPFTGRYNIDNAQLVLYHDSTYGVVFSRGLSNNQLNCFSQSVTSITKDTVTEL